MRKLKIAAAAWLVLGIALNVSLPSASVWSVGVNYHGWPLPALGFQGFQLVGGPPDDTMPIALVIDLLALFLPAIGLFTWARRIEARRPKPGSCRCGYDLRGSGDRCPECGASVMKTL